MLTKVALLNLRLLVPNCSNVLKDKPTTQFQFRCSSYFMGENEFDENDGSECGRNELRAINLMSLVLWCL
jgi:hypothetical protein